MKIPTRQTQFTLLLLKALISNSRDEANWFTTKNAISERRNSELNFRAYHSIK
jgi:hypothetical protein